METEHGIVSALCRRAVLAARHAWPLINCCERSLLDISDQLPIWVDYQLPRKFLKESTEIYLGNQATLSRDNIMLCDCKMDTLQDSMEDGPESLIPLAVVAASHRLLFAKDDPGNEDEHEMWQEALQNGYTDHDMESCDRYGRDLYYWVFWAQFCEIDVDEKRERRVEFWQRWLGDVVDVNTRSLEELNSDLRHLIQ